jgi:hypothetical protein
MFEAADTREWRGRHDLACQPGAWRRAAAGPPLTARAEERKP